MNSDLFQSTEIPATGITVFLIRFHSRVGQKSCQRIFISRSPIFRSIGFLTECLMGERSHSSNRNRRRKKLRSKSSKDGIIKSLPKTQSKFIPGFIVE